MRFQFQFFIVGYLLFFCPNNSFAQQYYFNHLTAEDGLSSNVVKCINKDSRGYLWVGCDNALNRYDGSKFVRYVHNPTDSTSISSGAIQSIFEDQEDRLWISSKNGVCLFNYKTEKFTQVTEAGAEITFGGIFYVSIKNEFFLCTPMGLYLLDKATNKFKKYFQSSVDLRASSMLEDQFGNLYIGTWENGLIVFKENRKDFLIKKIQEGSNSNSIESLVIDKSGVIWIGTRNGFYYGKMSRENDISSLEINPVPDSNGNPLQISNTMVHSLVIDENDKIWIGTENGLNIYDPKSKNLQTLFSKKSSVGSISNNLINCFYEEPGVGIWVGTYQGGINFYSKGNVPFKDKIPYITQSDNKKIQYAKSIYQDFDGKYWIGTDYGLHRFSKQFQLEKNYTNSSQTGSLSIGGVNAIYTDRLGEFWVGMWGGGVNRLDKTTDTFIKYSKIDRKNTTDSTLTGDCITRAFAEDSRGYLWVVNMFEIIDRYDRKNNSFKHFNIAQQVGRPNMEVKSVEIDQDDNLWIGATGAGLIKFNTKTFQTELFAPSTNNNVDTQSSLPSVDVYSVNINKTGKIWLGTGSGLCQFDPKTNNYTTYSTERGLNSEMVLGVVSDDHDHIWLSTLKGISKFDINTGYFINYDVSDGVISNAEVAYKSKNGMLFFAGVNGVTAFHPDSIWENQKAPPVVFTDFKLFDKSILFDQKLLPNHVNEVKEIELNYSQNSITIEFIALNFIQPKKNIYTCILEGFDEKWNFLGSKNETKYTNLNPGTYFFKVKAANNSGVWNNTERILKIIIRPPWWKTLPFRILIVIVIVLVTGTIIRLRTLQLEHQKRDLRIKVNERTLEIEKQQIELRNQAEELLKTNSLLILNQKEIESQKEAITLQKDKLEQKNKILEQQKEQILEQKLQTEKMASQLHEADQKKIKFLTNISHEFRTPLSLIFSPLEKSLREYGNIDKEKLHNRLKLMYRNTMRLLRLINEFLDISKIEAGLLKMSVGRGNINDFILGIIESYRYLAEQNRIQFTYLCEINKPICFFDADKIEKIIHNLLSNAFKYTPSEGKIIVKLIAVETNTDHETEMLQITVEDTGIGINEEFKSKIFERFFQIDTNEEQISGTGIGLALTQELIAIYGGKISLESEPGIGSKFIVSLPCSAQHFKANEITKEIISTHNKSIETYYSNELTNVELPGTDEKNPDPGKSTVLLVEDNKDIIQFLQEQFSEDFNFVYALNGFSGFEKAVSIFPQAIILDVMMPKMNGYQLCEKLKKDERTCHIPVIFLTALAEKAEQMEGLENGADDYITKPFDVDLLKIKVNNLIETRERLKLLYQKKLTIDAFQVIPDSFDEKLMQKIMAIADKEISNSTFGVEELSKIVGLSRTHLYRKIREITNQSPVEFIRNLRLEKAARLLKENKFYVSEVAYMAGFTEMSYFRKIFKEFYGMTPSDYASGVGPSTEITDPREN
jgi:signal transduction histidine kinase/ligand-binding sensor domain-containing protein/DNA-binding response OmpR family regulator